MLFIPLGVGIIVGIIVFCASLLIKKKSDNLFFAQIPGYLGIVASLVLFIIGYVYVRGFGGAAYILCALPIFIFSTIVFLKVRK